MPPSTALLFALYGTAVFFGARTPLSRIAYRMGMTIGTAGTVLALLLLFLSWKGMRLEAEHVGISIAGIVSGARIGHMSPVTALCFVLAGLSLVASFASSRDRQRLAMAGFWLACAVMLAGIVLLLAYLFGAPLLYGGEFIPPAFTSSLALTALGAALLALTGPRAWAPEQQIDAATLRASRSFILVFALMGAGLVTVGTLYFRNHEKHYRRQVEHQLSAVAKLKVGELVRWREDQRDDARILSRSSAFYALVRRAFANPLEAQARNQLQGWLREIREDEGYDGVFLLDAQGVARISIPDNALAADATEHAREALRSGRLGFLDFHRNEAKGRPHLSLLVPIVGATRGGRPLGVVVLDIDPSEHLYPSLERWPVPSRSAETLLVRRDGNDALVLNELRFRKNTALSLRFPLSRTELPAVKAALGQTGIVEGVNSSRGPVIAALRAVPDSPWVLVARMDTAEFLEPMRQDLWLTAGLVGGLLFAAGAAVGLIWRHQRVRHYKERFRTAAALAHLKDLYDMLSQTNQAIVRMTRREDLFPVVCRIAVEHGHFRFAWISLIDKDRQHLKPVAEYGDDTGYVAQKRVSADASDPSGRGPSGQALRSGDHAVSNDFLNDPAAAPWHEAARRAGVRASAAFPIRESGTMVGVMTLCAGEPGFFTEDMLPTLDEMAVDVSFALDSFRQKAELAQADEALRASELNYRQLFAANPHPMWVYDLETLRFLAVNDAAVTHYGYTRNEFQTMTIADIRPAEDIPRLLQDVANAKGMKIRSPGVWRHRKKDGTLIEAEITTHALDFGGRRTEVVLAHDVTERLAAINTLRQSEERFRATFEQAAVGMAHVAPDGRWLRVNQKLCDIVGYTREELLARSFQDITHPDDLERDLVQMRQLLAREIPTYSMEKRYLRKGGAIVWIDLTVALVRKDSGEPDYFISVVEDISARKQIEEALRTAEQQFRGLVEQSIAGIYVIQDDKLVYANPRLAEILAYDCADLIGRDVLSVVAENDRAMVVAKTRRWLASKEPSLDYDCIALRHDGSTIKVGVHGAHATYRQRPAIIGMIQDISDKKRAEEEIQRYLTQLETAFMSTVEVATTMSEMRDPYTAGHERRVGEIAVAIGTEMGFDKQRLEGLRVAGYLHDIGKITIPAEILSKPGKLSPIEFQLIKGHSQASYNVLKDVKFPWPVAQVALQHHERMDGSGYPQGLKGEDILLEARILAVSDVIEAMASHRPYRPSLGIDKALAEIERGRGSAYDSVVADACLKLFREKGYALPA